MTQFVSVIMPLHNRADTVGDAARSVLAQTHTDLELIVVDDASTDDGAAVVTSLADQRIRVVHLDERGGPGRARNAGLDEARGRFIAFQDSDDEWHPNKLELQLEVLEASRVRGDLVAGIGCTHDALVAPGGPWPDPGSHATYYRRMDVLSACSGGAGTPKLLIDLSVAAVGCRFDEDLAVLEDRDFLYRSMGVDSKFAVIDAPLVRVRRGRADHQSDSARALVAYERMLTKHEDDLSAQPAIRGWYRYMAMREALAGRDMAKARQLRATVMHHDVIRVNLEYALGVVFGRSGLAVAQRLRVRPDWSHRCACPLTNPA